MPYCTSCGSPIPEGQGSSCSMCYGDVGYGRDGYYQEWMENRENQEEENREEVKEKIKMNNNNSNTELINYYNETLIKNSEQNYQLELHGEPRYQYVIGCDFGLITTNITITKITLEGIKIVRNTTIQGITISEQSLLVKQLWKDYNKAVAIILDLDKVGRVIVDQLSLPSIDPRDGEELPAFVSIDDENSKGIKILNFIRFINSKKYVMAIRMKKALEDCILYFPKCNEFSDLDYNNTEITQLKKEICDIKVKSENNGTSLSFKRDSEDQINPVSRFTSALLSINGALDYFNKLTQ
jgi:hypothetical protein